MTDAEKIAAAKAWFRERFNRGATVTIEGDYFIFENAGFHMESRIAAVLMEQEGKP